MNSNSKMKLPLQNLIGGPWLLIGMAVVSLVSLIVALVKRKNLMKYPPVPLKELDYEDLEGVWYEYAGFRKKFQLDHVAASYEFQVREDNRVNLIHEIRFGTADGPSRKVKKNLSVPDISQPSSFEMKAFPGRKIPVKIVYLNNETGILVLTTGKCYRPHVLTQEWPINEDVYDELVKRMKEDAGVNLNGLEILNLPEERQE